MGALRACELYPYGMIGIGTIFNDYKKGVIDSDDDVSVALNPDTLEQLSQPWINLNKVVDNLKQGGFSVDYIILPNGEKTKSLHKKRKMNY